MSLCVAQDVARERYESIKVKLLELKKEKHDQEQEGSRPPYELCCPLTCDLFVDPVVAADGHTYERAMVEFWLSKSTRQSSPITNLPLPNDTLLENHTVSSHAHAQTHTQTHMHANTQTHTHTHPHLVLTSITPLFPLSH